MPFGDLSRNSFVSNSCKTEQYSINITVLFVTS